MMNPLSNLAAPKPSEPRASVGGAPAESTDKNFEHMLSGTPKGKSGNSQPQAGAHPAKSAASGPRSTAGSAKGGTPQNEETEAQLSFSGDLERPPEARIEDSPEAIEELDQKQNAGDPTLEALLIGIPLSVSLPTPEPGPVPKGIEGEAPTNDPLSLDLAEPTSAELLAGGQNQSAVAQPLTRLFQQPLGLSKEPSPTVPLGQMKLPFENTGLHPESATPGVSLPPSALPKGAQTGPSWVGSPVETSQAAPRDSASLPGQNGPSQLTNDSGAAPEGMIPQAAESLQRLPVRGEEAAPAGQTIQQALAQAAQTNPTTGTRQAPTSTPESRAVRRETPSTLAEKPLFQAGPVNPLTPEETLRVQDSDPRHQTLGKDAQTPGPEEEETAQPSALQAALKPNGMAPAMQEGAMQKAASNRSNSSRAAAFAASENSAAGGTEFFPQSTTFPGQPAVMQSPAKAAEVTRLEMTSIVNQAVDAAQQIKATGPERVEVKLQLESGETLSIQLQLSRGEVKPVFRAESESLRIALEQNWAQFSNRAEERGVRLASAVFESPQSSLGMNDQSGQQSGRERGQAASPQEDLFSPTPFRRTPAVTKNAPASQPTASVQLYA
jgi:hypothetical protein